VGWGRRGEEGGKMGNGAVGSLNKKKREEGKEISLETKKEKEIGCRSAVNSTDVGKNVIARRE